jgi:hypothetical protein
LFRFTVRVRALTRAVIESAHDVLRGELVGRVACIVCPRPEDSKRAARRNRRDYSNPSDFRHRSP